MQTQDLSQENEPLSQKVLWTKVLTMGAVGSATMTIAIVIGGLIGLAIVGSPVNLGDNYIIILLGVLIGAILLIAAGENRVVVRLDNICLSIPVLYMSVSVHVVFVCSMHAAADKSLQSCPTLCDPIDGSPPGSSVPGILQARILGWVAISFSNA